MTQGIKFITDLSSLTVTTKYDGTPYGDTVVLGDLNYPLDNMSDYSVFGAWKDSQTGKIIHDADSIPDGSTLIAVNTSPIGVAEVNAFVADSSSQVRKYIKLNNHAPRRLQGTYITKYSKLAWVDIAQNVSTPKGFPFKGISTSSNGDPLISVNDSTVGDFTSSVVASTSNSIAYLPIYDIFVSDFKGQSSATSDRTTIKIDGNGGKLASNRPYVTTPKMTPKYGETIKELLTRANLLQYTDATKMTPPTPNQYFQGWLGTLYTINGFYQDVPLVADVPTDLTQTIYPPIDEIIKGTKISFKLVAKWGTYTKNADGTNNDKSNATLYDSNGNTIGTYKNLPKGTTTQDLINGKYAGTDASGNTIPAGTNQTPNLGDVTKKLRELANNEKVKAVQWLDSDLIQQDNSKPGLTYDDLSKKKFEELSQNWATVTVNDGAKHLSPASESNTDKLPSVQIGSSKLSITKDKTILYGDLKLYLNNGWAKDTSTDDYTWTQSDHKLTFKSVKKSSDISNMEGFGPFGTAYIEPDSTGTTLNNGVPVNPATDVLQPGDNDINTSGADSNYRPVTSANPARVKTVGSDSKTKDLSITPENVGKPLGDLTKYDLPNYAISGGFVITTKDGRQVIVDPSDENWADKIGGIDQLPGSTITQIIKYPAGRFVYYGDANGGTFFDGTTIASLFSNLESLTLAQLSVMMPIATKGVLLSAGFNDTDSTTVSPDITVVQSSATVYAYYKQTRNALIRYPREFYLVDTSTITTDPKELDSFSFNDIAGIDTGIIATSPTGLGYTNHTELNESYSDWTTPLSIKTTTVDPSQITFTLFMKDYMSYAKFGNWLNNKKLALYYLNDTGTQSFINVQLDSLPKTELSTSSVGYIQTTLTLLKTSSWYDIKPIREDGVFNNNILGFSGNAYTQFVVTGTFSAKTVTVTLQKLASDGASWIEIAHETVNGWASKDTFRYSSIPNNNYVMADNVNVSSLLDFLTGSQLIASGNGTYRLVPSVGTIEGTVTREKQI